MHMHPTEGLIPFWKRIRLECGEDRNDGTTARENGQCRSIGHAKEHDWFMVRRVRDRADSSDPSAAATAIGVLDRMN